MKCVKKLVAVLLTAVMALTLLTACGGGGGASSAETGNQLTAKINNQLADDNSDIRLTYNDKLSSQAIICLQYYQRTGDEDSALQMANLNEQDYKFIAIDVNQGASMEYAASLLAVQIEALENNWGKAKQVGYAEAELLNTQPKQYRLFVLLKK